MEAADILDSDLQLVTRQAPTQIGPDGEFFMAPRIDDLECAATTLLGFLDASGETDSACAPVWAMFDNEEVGSSSRMGAESSYLRDVLDRILEAVPHSAQASHRAMANSFMLSADNAHATHPNFPQKSDPCAPVRLGGGVVLKYNASQKYTTNAVSGAIFRAICRKPACRCRCSRTAPTRPAAARWAICRATRCPSRWQTSLRPVRDAQCRRDGQRRRRRGHDKGRGRLLPCPSACPWRRHLHAGMSTGRYAPSPSGRMHLGNLMCCLLAWLSAKSKGGQVLLRIEDLDTQRCPRSYADAIVDDLAWLGLAADGPTPPVYQSDRSEIYQRYFDELSRRGLVYPCFCSRSQLHAASAPHRSDGQVIYAGTCRGLTPAEIAERSKTRAPAWRVQVPDEVIAFEDGHMGHYEENLARDCGDFFLRRADGVFAYQLAVVVDDALMGVDEVVRGSDLLSSTPRQLWLYRELGLTPPKFYHLPLLLASDGRRLSKRDGDQSLENLRAKYTPEEIIGKLAFACGLQASPAPTTPQALARTFDWSQVPKSDIVLPENLF